MSMTDKSYCVPDLQKERKSCWFNKEEITHLLDDGKDKTEFRHAMERYFLSDREFLDSVHPDYLSHEDRYANELRKACRIYKLLNDDETVQDLAGGMEGMRLLMGSGLGSSLNKDGSPLAVHFVMFIPALHGHGTIEQQAQWLTRAWSGEIIGTYAQTELGHGTYLKGLETTATYDPASDEFVLNSPSISSYKFWPGGLGKTANYAVVVAQLYTKGRCFGPNFFVVPLRDEKTHRSLPGVTVGEIGPRLGLTTNDNGFLGFKNYRIPRLNMLMKHSQVLKDGSYVSPRSDKLNYGTMVFVRVAICFDTTRQLQRAVTIATRYSAVRHQSKLLPDEPEPQVLDYQTQQYKLIPQIAAVFALTLAARKLWRTHNEATQHIDQGNLELMPELHALSCGLKAQSSSDCTYGVDTCRLACGGNGYICSSNLPRIFSQATAALTYEGENTVMWLQVARYIMKAYKHINVSRPGPALEYLSRQQGPSSDLSNKGILRKWEVAIVFLLQQVSGKVEKLCSKGLQYELALNACSVDLVKIAQAHVRYFTCDTFVNGLETLELSASTRSILGRLCRLYLLYHFNLNEGLLLKSGSVLTSDLAILEGEMLQLLALLRKDAVNLVDSFDIDDRILDSTLGCWDGNVYERLLKASMESPLNKEDVPPSIHKHLKPFMNSKL